MPNKRVIVVPSLASIEEMRSPAMEYLNNKTANRVESKIPRLEPNRTPFVDLN